MVMRLETAIKTVLFTEKQGLRKKLVANTLFLFFFFFLRFNPKAAKKKESKKMRQGRTITRARRHTTIPALFYNEPQTDIAR